MQAGSLRWPECAGDAELDRVRRLIGRVLPGDVAWAAARIEAGSHGIFAAEAAFVATAREKRRHEFFSGRRAARSALAELGRPPVAIMMGHDRAPVWPAGVVGSITHSGAFCVAVVAPTARYASIGIDLEAAQPLEAEMAALVCTPREIAACRDPAFDLPAHATRLFAVKEAFYKCAYPRLRRFLDFQDVEADLADSGRCSARLAEPDAAHRSIFTATGASAQDARFVFAFLGYPDTAAAGSEKFGDREHDSHRHDWKRPAFFERGEATKR